MSSIVDIEGVGESYAQKLREIGLTTVESLLEKGAQPDGRADIAQKTGISAKLILKWVNHADLFRINGVAGQFAELLEAAGVDTVVELAQRNAENLHIKLEAVNKEKNLCNAVPALAQITRWIAEAKALPRAVHY